MRGRESAERGGALMPFKPSINAYPVASYVGPDMSSCQRSIEWIATIEYGPGKFVRASGPDRQEALKNVIAEYRRRSGYNAPLPDRGDYL